MKKITFLLFIAFLFFNVPLKSQTFQDFNTNSTIKKAEYFKEDLTKVLCQNLNYAIEAQRNNIEGDVIISFLIDKNGKLDSIEIVSSPSEILTLSSLISFNQVEDEWIPCKVNGKPIDKKYLLVYRYRTWASTQPPNYKEKAEKLIEKEKYEKALKCYNKAIKENQFDYKLFELRSKINEILGDTESAIKDSQQANRIRNEIICFVDVGSLRIKRVSRLIKTEVVRVPH